MSISRRSLLAFMSVAPFVAKDVVAQPRPCAQPNVMRRFISQVEADNTQRAYNYMMSARIEAAKLGPRSSLSIGALDEPKGSH